MLFFKKKKIQQPNWIDNKIDEYRDMLFDIRYDMRKNVKNILVTEQFIKILPNGPDKNSEEEMLEKYKYALLCNIGSYDGVLADWRILLEGASEEDKANMINKNTVPKLTSHEYIKDLLFYDNK